MSDRARFPCVTTDAVLGGRLTLQQPSVGHRAGTDAVLLAAAAPVAAEGLVADIGAGVGTVGLAVALHQPAVRVRLVERDPVLCELARRNASANALAERVSVDGRDIFGRDPVLADADLVLSNPPFFEAGTMRASPTERRRSAHLLETPDRPRAPGHGDWLRAVLRFAAPHATVVLIHRAEALPALLEAAAGRLGGIRVRPVLTRADRPASRVLFGGRIGSRAPFGLLADLVLHDAAGAPTALSRALHAGEVSAPLFEPLTRKRRPRGPASPSHET